MFIKLVLQLMPPYKLLFSCGLKQRQQFILYLTQVSRKHIILSQKPLNLIDNAPLVVEHAAVSFLQTARSAVKGGEGQIGFA